MTISRVVIVFALIAFLAPIFVFASSEDEMLMNMERKMFETIKNKDLKAFGAMLTDDAINVDPMNLSWSKAEIVQYLTPFVLEEYNLKDMKVIWFDKDCAAVFYVFSGKGKIGDQEMPPGDTRVSTIWVKKGDQWLARYHQESPVMPPAK